MPSCYLAIFRVAGNALLAYILNSRLNGYQNAQNLVVEDEDKLRKALTQGLSEQGYDVTAVGDGHDGLALAVGESFDCLLLDMMLPGCEGLEIVRRMREAGDQTPTLMLTARGAIEDRVLGLDSGADDYLSKPFSWAELLARIRVCLRRNEMLDSPVILRFGDLALDCARRKLACGEREPLAGLTNVIEVYVSYLRKKLARLDDPTVIQTIRGVGYRLETPS